MATPTPSGSKKTFGGGSTPSHLNQSSPPRSVPSPVTARHPAGKTPVNHPTTGSSSGSKTLAGTPMVQNLSQGGNTSSPSANMLGLGTPSGLGIEGVTPGLTGLTPGLGAGVPMMHSMSDLSLTTNGAKRNEDEERRMKMRKVLQKIGRDKGRVSEEGIARTARRVGFANDIDSEKLTPEELERKRGNRPISTAGNAIVIVIDMKSEVPQGVEVAYSTQSKLLEDHGARAGKVLMDNLKAPNGIALNAKLDRYAVNLERLARLDRLSTNGINCFEAISGVYASLERLYEQEKEAAKALLKPGSTNAEERAEVEVMCKKSGKPLVNADGKIGTELAYWKDNRHVKKATPASQTDTQMDIDGQDNKQNAGANDDHDQVFKLRLEAEPCPAAMYPAIRVSDAWLPESLQLPSLDSGEGLPWQDPPSTFITPADTQPGSVPQLPNLRFVAKLDPPLVVPYNLAINIHNALGNHVMISSTYTYSQMLLDPTSAPLPGQKSFTARAEHPVLSIKNGQETTVKHFYKLQSAKIDAGVIIDQLPFTHPRQLVELLPTLRQWAYIGSTLRAVFDTHQQSNGHAASNGFDSMNDAVKPRSALDDLLMDVDTGSSDSIAVDIAVTPGLTPSLGISFPNANGNDVANIIVEVLPNAELTATDREAQFRAGKSPKTEETQRREVRFAKALDACGDVGVWVEWVRAQG